ncbi:sensor histidine kinase [Jeongeupia naejangsanensis]|uniref:histidine kinase n=1 Tax=Jeongeupia naejangsanensis TaxID=613195 RepID=A0ABS2BNZ5_9NEIS|nr:ATP-binding protein [Jeongeupia naejangsanensis]MBM3117357.1 sensor histidine kinase [Jeongeupia naejangsanensis]
MTSARSRIAAWLRLLRPLRWPVVAAVVLVVLAMLASWSSKTETARVRELGQNRLDIYASSLRNAIERYDALPIVLSTHPDIMALLRNPDAPGLRDKISRYLALSNGDTRSTVLYLLDTDGMTLAASNWDTPQSYVGKNYAFRPYFLQAKEGRAGHFYGIGFTTHQPGYFLSYPVRDGNKVVGVVVAKINLDAVEREWPRGGGPILVADSNGIVFLSNAPELKWRALAPLPAEMLRYIADTHQYGDRREFVTLGLSDRELLDTGVERAELDAGGTSRSVLVQRMALGGLGWHLVTLNDLAPVRQAVRHTLIGALFALLALASLLLYWRQYRRRMLDRLQASSALRHTQTVLEREVAMRGGELAETQLRLQRETAERQKLEARLRIAHDKLLHAGKLAVLGQMTAALVRELGQPLAAVRVLTHALRGAPELAEGTRTHLDGIGAHATRIAALTTRLGAYARRSDDRFGPVLLRGVIDNAVLLLETQFRQQQVRLDLDQSDSRVRVSGNPAQLEQLLVSLLRNALDAVQVSPQPVIRVSVERSGPRVQISISDNGPGIAEAELTTLFDPFAAPDGNSDRLGLGLVTAKAIAGDCGGRLSATNQPEGGAMFVLELSVVDWEP